VEDRRHQSTAECDADRQKRGFAVVGALPAGPAHDDSLDVVVAAAVTRSPPPRWSLRPADHRDPTTCSRARGGGPEPNVIPDSGGTGSPPSRRWPLGTSAADAAQAVLPALAGVVPETAATRRSCRRALRARGGGPQGRRHVARLGRVLPALAGVVSRSRRGSSTVRGAVRTRGVALPQQVSSPTRRVPRPRGVVPFDDTSRRVKVATMEVRSPCSP
jgi:hypothetical protein